MDILFLVNQINGNITLTKLQRSFNRVGQAGTSRSLILIISILRDNETIHHGFDSMLLIAIQADFIIEAMNVTIHAGARETRLADLLEDCLVRPLAGAHQRRKDEDTCSIGKLLDLV